MNRHVKTYLLALLFFSRNACCALANEYSEEAMKINSGQAEYNGNEITLTGDVSIQHSLGKISAHQLTIRSETQKKEKFSVLNMKDDIFIELQGGGKLHCQQAHIDYANLKGTFLGNEAQPDVTYADIQKEKGGQTTPLIVKSRQIQAELIRQLNPKHKRQQTMIRTLQAIGGVRAFYNQDYLISADQAVYQRESAEEGSVGGVITLLGSDPIQKSCVVTNQNGDQITALQIEVDTIKHLLTFYAPEGSLLSKKEGKSTQQIQFSSDMLFWDDLQKTLVLQQNVNVKLGAMGNLKTPVEVRVYQIRNQDKTTVQSIIAPQETEFSYTDENKILHKVICHGPLTIDHEHLKITLQSPQNTNGTIDEDKQVYFEDQLGDIYANEIELAYNWVNHSLVPTQLTMKGKVKILNRYDGHIQESSSVLQYALADHVVYDSQNKLMTLTGPNGNRVLFYDKVNNLQMSAPALKIKRDEKTHKGSIQGIGDVRFTFIEHEFDQLRQHFQLKENSQ